MLKHWYSFRVIILAALAGLVILAYSIAYYSTAIYYDLAINNQKESIENLLKFQTSGLVKDLQETQKIFAYKLIKEQRFKYFLKKNDHEMLTGWLSQSFKRYFVTAGLLDLHSLHVKDLSYNDIAYSSKNETIANNGCDSINRQLATSSGIQKLKPKYALCFIKGDLYSEVMVPIGVLKPKGYLRVMAKVEHELQKLEYEMNIPIQLLSPSGQQLFSSEHWFEEQLESDLLLTYILHDDIGQSGMLINGLFSLKAFETKIKNTQQQFMQVTTFVTGLSFMLVAYFLNMAYTPLRRLKNSAKLLVEGTYKLVEEKKLPYELEQLVQAFNTMLLALEGESKKRSMVEEHLKDEKDFISTTLNSISNAVIVVGLDGKIQYINTAAELIFMTTKTQLLGFYLHEAISFYKDNNKETRINHQDFFTECDNKHDPEQSLFVWNNREHMKEIEYSCALMRRGGKKCAYVFIYKDVTEDRELRRQLKFDAYHDRLTGLLNRHAFEQYFWMLIEEDSHEIQEHIMIYMDLDQFKVVNDVCGHAAGDSLLQKLTEKFKTIVRESDIIARLGGDEFGLILPHCPLKKAEQLVQSIIKDVVDYRFVWDEKVFTIGISIGISPFGLSEDTLEEQMSAVDAACYIAKKFGGNQYHLYNKDDKNMIAHKGAMDWVAGINKGLSENRFKLYIQPITSLGSETETEHYEVLIRYIDDDGSIIPPDAFLPSAERYNLISRIDLFVINTIIEWLSANQKSRPDIAFSINISGRSLGDRDFQVYLEDILKTTHIDTTALCFEITETAIVADVMRSVEFIKSIKALGVKFSLDDFGSGLSSFAYLKQFPVDYLKIDGMFVKDIVAEPTNYVFVRSMAEVGHCLGMKVIAEFVETEELYHSLRQAKVDFIQGWAVGKPRPISSLNKRS